MMGHEPAGTIVQVGEGVIDYKTGDKVAVSCRSQWAMASQSTSTGVWQPDPLPHYTFVRHT